MKFPPITRHLALFLYATSLKFLTISLFFIIIGMASNLSHNFHAQTSEVGEPLALITLYTAFLNDIQILQLNV